MSHPDAPHAATHSTARTARWPMRLTLLGGALLLAAAAHGLPKAASRPSKSSKSVMATRHTAPMRRARRTRRRRARAQYPLRPHTKSPCSPTAATGQQHSRALTTERAPCPRPPPAERKPSGDARGRQATPLDAPEPSEKRARRCADDPCPAAEPPADPNGSEDGAPEAPAMHHTAGPGRDAAEGTCSTPDCSRPPLYSGGGHAAPTVPQRMRRAGRRATATAAAPSTPTCPLPAIPSSSCSAPTSRPAKPRLPRPTCMPMTATTMMTSAVTMVSAAKRPRPR